MIMICTFLRAAQCAEKLRRSSGKRLFPPHLVLNKARLRTAPSLSWGVQEREKTVQPKCILGVPRKALWTQGQSAQRGGDDGSKQVSVHAQRGETGVSTSQKGNGRDQSCRRRDEGCPVLPPGSVLKIGNSSTQVRV